MKKSILLLASIITLSISLSSCKEDDDVLPAITMEGRNTFGCLVNGEVWLPEGRGGGSLPILVDMTVDNFLSISATNNSDNTRLGLVLIDSTGLKVNQLYILSNKPTNYGRYSFRTENGICFYDHLEMISGEMVITKLENQIISGTFEFTTYNPDCGDTIRVTEGRFDIGNITH